MPGDGRTRNLDIAILLGGGLMGTGLAQWVKTADFRSAVLLITGLAILLGVVVYRISESRPPSAKGGRGVRIYEPVFSGCTVRCTVALAEPRYGLWVSCDTPGFQVTKATLYQEIKGGARGEHLSPSFDLMSIGCDRCALVLFPSAEKVDQDVRGRTETDLLITAPNEVRRVRVRIAESKHFEEINRRAKEAPPRMRRPPREDPPSTTASE